MIVDLRRESITPELAADVCLVGAGAAGIALALQLSKAGLSVALVESGGLEPGKEGESLNEGQVHGTSYQGLVTGRARTLGGATRLWYGQCIRYDPIDFAPRPWVKHSGWPISLEELDQPYGEAEHFFGIEGEHYDARVYDKFNLPRPALNEQLSRMCFTVYTPAVDLGRIHLPELRRTDRITVLLNATVTEVLTNDAGTCATGVRIVAPSGRRHTLQSRAVVLCGGGLENARLLLLSNTIKPAGLGNDHDLVGRFLQDHPNGQTATLRTNNALPISELFALLYKRPLRYFPKFALSPARQQELKLLNANGHFVFEYPENSGLGAAKELFRSLRHRRVPPNATQQMRKILLDLPSTAAAAKRFLIDRKSPLGTPSRIRFQCYLEQEPDPESRVQLSDELDPLGQRRLRVNWKLNDLERRTLASFTSAMASQIGHLGYGQLEPDDWLEDPDADWRSRLVDAYHPIGTTKMGADPSSGVVDRNCEVFGVSGLFLAGSSVFPTSGYANPTLTIVALALRLGHHLKTHLG